MTLLINGSNAVVCLQAPSSLCNMRMSVHQSSAIKLSPTAFAVEADHWLTFVALGLSVRR